ncbi:hypothetical protein Tdes44962_MAKER00406 [Teratosphaeria destructans]|uniref:Uncharacterized protein n=1 Tax=Teratosphaeria destructans TaxID=418781 RepID=A0A9W7W2R9_9PEZI|nr:hypothetical protein Tdes44962_MAKER00406 [Teratosphaeria destructans]
MEHNLASGFDVTIFDQMLDEYVPGRPLLDPEAEQLEFDAARLQLPSQQPPAAPPVAAAPYEHGTFDWTHFDLPLPGQQPQPQPQPQQDNMYLAAANEFGMGDFPPMPPFQEHLPPAAIEWGALPHEQPALPPRAPSPPSSASPDASSTAEASSSRRRTGTSGAGRAKGPKEENGRSKAQNRGAVQGWSQALRVHQRRCGVQPGGRVHDRECQIREHSQYEKFSSESVTRINLDGKKFRCPKEWQHLYEPPTTTRRKPNWLKRAAEEGPAGNAEQGSEY